MRTIKQRRPIEADVGLKPNVEPNEIIRRGVQRGRVGDDATGPPSRDDGKLWSGSIGLLTIAVCLIDMTCHSGVFGSNAAPFGLRSFIGLHWAPGI